MSIEKMSNFYFKFLFKLLNTQLNFVDDKVKEFVIEKWLTKWPL